MPETVDTEEKAREDTAIPRTQREQLIEALELGIEDRVVPVEDKQSVPDLEQASLHSPVVEVPTVANKATLELQIKTAQDQVVPLSF